jgi:hypothetical protein
MKYSGHLYNFVLNHFIASPNQTPDRYQIRDHFVQDDDDTTIQTLPYRLLTAMVQDSSLHENY